MAANWFGPHEQNIATSLASLIGLFGSATAFGLGVIVDSKTGNRVSYVLLIDAIICIAIFILILIFYRSKPPTPPTAECDSSEKEESDWRIYLNSFKNIPLVIITIVYAIGFGSVQSFSALINQFVAPQGYSSVLFFNWYLFLD